MNASHEKSSSIAKRTLGVIAIIVPLVEFVNLVATHQSLLLKLFTDPLLRQALPSITAATMLALFLYYRHRYVTLRRQLPTTITILLPLANAGKNARKDGEYQLQGVAGFLAQECNLTGDVHLAVFDSFPPTHGLTDEQKLARHNDYLREILHRQHAAGCRYFLCTMSQIFLKVAPLLQELNLDKRGRDRAILLSTVAATTRVQGLLDGESIFRYYPRSTEEAASLAEWITHENIEVPIIARMNSFFGEDLENALRNSLRDTCPPKAIPTVQDNMTCATIRSQIEDELRKMPSGTKRCIILVLYGEALPKAIQAINEIKQPLLIASASTLSVALSTGLPLGSQHSWYTCVPREHNPSHDVIAHYVSSSIKHYVTCIRQMNRSKEPKAFRDLFAKQLPASNSHYQITDHDVRIDMAIRQVQSS